MEGLPKLVSRILLEELTYFTNDGSGRWRGSRILRKELKYFTNVMGAAGGGAPETSVSNLMERTKRFY